MPVCKSHHSEELRSLATFRSRQCPALTLPLTSEVSLESRLRSRNALFNMSAISNASSMNRLEDDTLRLVLSLLDVRSRCVASCVCSR